MNAPKSLPGPMREIVRLANEMPAAALLTMGAEVKRQMIAKETLSELSAFLKTVPEGSGWIGVLEPWLATWVRDRFGLESTWVKTGGKDPRPPQFFVRAALEGACLGATAYALDAISVAAYRDACRAWQAGQAVDA